MSTAPLPHQPAIVGGVFHDADDFAEAATGWDLELRQLDAGLPENRIEVLAGQETLIHRFNLSHALHQYGSPPAGQATYGLPEETSRLSWMGQELRRAAIVDFNDRGAFEFVSGADFSAVTISIRREWLAGIATQLRLSTSRVDERGLPPPRSASDTTVALFRDYVKRFVDHLGDSPELLDSKHVARLLDKEIPFRLLNLVAVSGRETERRPLHVRQRGLRLAIEFIEACSDENPSIPDICAACGLSWRSLDRAFKESFDLGPKRYVMNFRLARVRRELKNSPPETKVADVANAWGFWHMGDFAREYRKLFGENPNQSLRTFTPL